MLVNHLHGTYGWERIMYEATKLAARNNRVDVVEYLISKEIECYTCAFEEAVVHNHLDIIKLSEKTINGNILYIEEYIYDIAAAHGQLDVFEYIFRDYEKKPKQDKIDHPDPSENSHYEYYQEEDCLNLSTRRIGHLNIVKFLVENGLRVNSTIFDHLFDAIKFNHKDIADYLISKGTVSKKSNSLS